MVIQKSPKYWEVGRLPQAPPEGDVQLLASVCQLPSELPRLRFLSCQALSKGDPTPRKYRRYGLAEFWM